MGYRSCDFTDECLAHLRIAPPQRYRLLLLRTRLRLFGFLPIQLLTYRSDGMLTRYPSQPKQGAAPERQRDVQRRRWQQADAGHIRAKSQPQ
jgi:hypothetical protein